MPITLNDGYSNLKAVALSTQTKKGPFTVAYTLSEIDITKVKQFAAVEANVLLNVEGNAPDEQSFLNDFPGAIRVRILS